MSQVFDRMQTLGGSASSWLKPTTTDALGSTSADWQRALVTSMSSAEKSASGASAGASSVDRRQASKPDKAKPTASDPSTATSSTRRDEAGAKAEDVDASVEDVAAEASQDELDTDDSSGEVALSPKDIAQQASVVAAGEGQPLMLASQSGTSGQAGQVKEGVGPTAASVMQSLDEPAAQGQTGQASGDGEQDAQTQEDGSRWMMSGQDAKANQSAATKSGQALPLPGQEMQMSASASQHATVGVTAGGVQAGDASASVAEKALAMMQVDSANQEEMDPNVARVAQGLRGAINLREGAVTIRLNPSELGQVRIEMAIKGGVVQAELQADQASVRDLLTHQLGRLRETLQGRGLVVERLEVSAPSPSDHAHGGGQESTHDGRSQGQFFNQQRQASSQSQQGQAGGESGALDRPGFAQMLVDMVG